MSEVERLERLIEQLPEDLQAMAKEALRNLRIAIEERNVDLALSAFAKLVRISTAANAAYGIHVPIDRKLIEQLSSRLMFVE